MRSHGGPTQPQPARRWFSGSAGHDTKPRPERTRLPFALFIAVGLVGLAISISAVHGNFCGSGGGVWGGSDGHGGHGGHRKLEAAEAECGCDEARIVLSKDHLGAVGGELGWEGSDATVIAEGVVTTTPSGDATHAASRLPPSILILTPVKNAAKHLDLYFKNLRRLSYSKARISLGLMDSDSDDAPSDSVLARLEASGDRRVQRALKSASRVRPSSAQNISSAAATAAVNGSSGAKGYGKSGLQLTGTFGKLLGELPSLSSEFHRVTLFQHNFGLHLSRAERHSETMQRERRSLLARSRNHLLSTALRDEDFVLWIDSDLDSYPPDVIQRLLAAGKQIVVPNCVMQPGARSYDLNSWRVANGTAYGNGASVSSIRRMHDREHAQLVAAGTPHLLLLEGYSRTGHKSLSSLRGEGEVVRLDAVGGAMLLVDAELHRHGLVFPPFVYRHRIETEGLSMMALDMGVLSWGMPHVEVLHH